MHVCRLRTTERSAACYWIGALQEACNVSAAAVHVLRYVLSSGYQMRALHEYTVHVLMSADLDYSTRNSGVLVLYDV